MQAKESTIEILNDLININNDRIAGYQRAINESKDLDVDLKSLFESMVSESQTYKEQLMDKSRALGENMMDDNTTTGGDIYRAWMDIKATFTGHDRKSILESCEFGEDAWRRAYESALNTNEDLDPETRQLINDQYNSEKSSHDLIKKQRDAHNAID